MMNTKQTIMKLFTAAVAIGGMGLLGTQTAHADNGKNLSDLVTPADAFNTVGKTNQSFSTTTGNQTATYLVGPRLADGQTVGGEQPFPDNGSSYNGGKPTTYYQYKGFDSTLNPLLKYYTSSQWVDMPNVNVKMNGIDYSTMYSDADTENEDPTFYTQTSSPFNGLLYTSSALMLNSSTLHAVPVKTDTGTTTFPDSASRFFSPAYTNVTSLTKNDSGMEIKFTSYYTRASNDASVGANPDASKTFSMDNDLKLTKLPNGSMQVEESSTNLSFDLENVYLARQTDSMVQDLKIIYDDNSAKADGLPFKYLNNNRGMYLDATSVGLPFRLTYEFDGNNAPTAWRGDFTNSGANTPNDKNGFYDMPIGGDKGIFTSLDATGDSKPTDPAAADSQVAAPVNAINNGTTDSGVTMKWGKYATWKKGDTITTSYIEGLSSASSPVLTVDQSKTHVAAGTKVNLTGFVTDSDAPSGKNENVRYSVDDASDSTGTSLTTIAAGGKTGDALGAIDTTGWKDGEHTVRLWAVDGDNNISSNVVTVHIVIGATSTMTSPGKLYWSQQMQSAATDPSAYTQDNNSYMIYQAGWLRGANNASDTFKIKLPTDDYSTTDGIWLGLFLDDEKNLFANASNSGFDSDNDIVSNQQLYTQSINGGYGANPLTDDYKHTHTFKLGQNVINTFGTVSDDNYYLTDNSNPFVIIAPKVTLDSSKTLVTDAQNSQTTLPNGNIITGTNKATSADGKYSYTQGGNNVYVFKDQGGDGVYTKADETYEQTTSNAIANTTADSDGNFTLKIPDNSNVKAGDKLWVINTNASGGTSGVAMTDKLGDSVINPDGTGAPAPYSDSLGYHTQGLQSGAGATGVTVQSAFGFTSYKNWDFGTDQAYDAGKQNNYSLKSSSNADGTTGSDALNFVDSLKTVQLNAKMSPLKTADGKNVVNGVKVLLKNTSYSSNASNTGTVNSSTIDTSGYSSVMQAANLSSSSTALTSWSVNFGSQGATTSDGVTLSVPSSQYMKNSAQYTSTINWQLVNSVGS